MGITPIAQRVFRRVRRGGVRGLVASAVDRVLPASPSTQPLVLDVTAGKHGLEVGGPSRRVFGKRGMLPVYPVCNRLDNINFATETAWEGQLQDGSEYEFDRSRPHGTQWLREAVALDGLGDESFDFVLSSHCLEHVANPLAALQEWCRITRDGGHLILVLPNPAKTFDHRRPVTLISHLHDDLENDTGEDDVTHVEEVLTLHDIRQSPEVASMDEFRARVHDNEKLRYIHQHVFDLALMSDALTDSGWTVLALEEARPMHLVALARKDRITGPD